MINYNVALAESIKAAVLELHRTLLINEGYRSLTRLSEQLESLERGQQSKIAVGQDWSPVRDVSHGSDEFQVAIDDLCDACGTPLGDMLVINVVANFILVRSMGIEGAAWATLLSLASVNAYRTWFLWKRYRLWPWSG